MQRSDLDQQTTPRDLLHQLVHRVECLRPCHRDPHRFHEEKSEIAHELTMLAGRIS